MVLGVDQVIAQQSAAGPQQPQGYLMELPKLVGAVTTTRPQQSEYEANQLEQISGTVRPPDCLCDVEQFFVAEETSQGKSQHCQSYLMVTQCSVARVQLATSEVSQIETISQGGTTVRA